MYDDGTNSDQVGLHADFNADLTQNSDVIIYNLAGSVIYQAQKEEHMQIHTSNWNSVIYIIHCEYEVFKLIVH